jgi:hypothetical protein
MESLLDLETCALLAGKHLIGLLVLDAFFQYAFFQNRIPSYRASEPYGNIRKMASRDTAVLAGDIADRRLFVLNARKEIAHMAYD